MSERVRNRRINVVFQHIYTESRKVVLKNFFTGQQWRNSGSSGRLFWGAPKSLKMVTEAMKLKDVYSLEGKL